MQIMQKYYKYIVIGLFIFFVWVYFQGTIERILFKELVPVKIPEEFFNLNQWLREEKGDFKVTWLPPQFDARVLDWAKDRKINDFLTISSGKPTIGPQAPFSRLYYLFFESVISQAPYLDKFFDVLNSKYLIFRKDLPEDYSERLLQSLQNNPHLRQVKEEGYLTIFENRNFAPHLWIPQNFYLVVGGMEALDILYSQKDFDPIKTGLIFANQEAGLVQKLKNLQFKKIIFNNSGLNDLIFSLIGEKYLIDLASLTDEGEGEWRKASTNEPLHGEWHRTIDTLHIPNWDFDFGKGLIYSEGQETVRVPLRVESSERHFLLIRYFQNNKGGKFKIILGNKEEMINTLNVNSRFTIKSLPFALSGPGQYWMTIKNLIGFNAINLIALVPESKYKEYRREAQKIIEEAPIIYLEKVNPIVTTQPLKLNLPRAGVYQLALRIKKDEERRVRGESRDKLRVSFGTENYEVDLDREREDHWYKLGRRYFKREEVVPLYLDSKKGSMVGVKDFFILDPGNLEWVGQKDKEESQEREERRVRILSRPQNPEKEGRLITEAISVGEGQGFYLEYKFQGENLAGVEGRVLFYGKDYDPIYMRRAFKVEYFMQKQEGDLEERKIAHFFGTPKDTYYLKLEFKARPNLQRDSWLRISDLKLFSQDEDATIEALVLTEEGVASKRVENLENHLQYTKLNPTRYMLSFSEEMKRPFVLSFAESYHPNWNLKDRTPLEKHSKAVNYFNKRVRSLLGMHQRGKIESFPLYSVINGFYIDPRQIESRKFILEYEPQNWFELGIFLSLTALGGCLGAIVIYKILKRKRTKRNSMLG